MESKRKAVSEDIRWISNGIAILGLLGLLFAVLLWSLESKHCSYDVPVLGWTTAVAMVFVGGVVITIDSESRGGKHFCFAGVMLLWDVAVFVAEKIDPSWSEAEDVIQQTDCIAYFIAVLIGCIPIVIAGAIRRHFR